VTPVDVGLAASYVVIAQRLVPSVRLLSAAALIVTTTLELINYILKLPSLIVSLKGVYNALI